MPEGIPGGMSGVPGRLGVIRTWDKARFNGAQSSAAHKQRKIVAGQIFTR
jgi:hypothetical protein